MTYTKLGPTHEEKIIRSTIHLRRRLDHAPIPSFDDYIGCPPRERLSVDEFAIKYGAHPGDLKRVTEYCRTHGLTIVDEHAARRQVTVEGHVRQHNAAWATTIHDHVKGEHQFHLATAKLPDHLADIVVHVGLGEIPKQRTTPTNVPANTPGVNEAAILPSEYASLMGWPNNGTGQTIGVVIFNLPTGYLLSDVQLNWAAWGLSNGTVTDIHVEDSSSNNDQFVGEWEMDISCAYGFGVGANIVVYWSTNIADTYSRIVHPNPGDPICSVTTESGILYDEAGLYADQPTLAAALHAIFEDAAIQSVTVCLPTGDFGSGGGVGDGKDHCGGNNDPYVLTVGGTVIGNVSGNQFVEWLASIGDSNSADYLQGGGGGVSLYVPLPSYQEGVNVPASTNGGTIGRGVPDVSSTFAGQFPMYTSGVLGVSFGGSSQSCPMTAGLIASINNAVGYNIGFINPTLYAQAGSVIRDINPGNSVGGPQTNSNGFYLLNGQSAYNPVPGYSLEYGYDACVGLGVLKGNALVSYLNGVTPLTPAYTLIQSIDNTLCSFWGGNVLDGCQITCVFWGSGWATASNPSSTAIETAINAIIGAGYFDLMNEYYVFNRPIIVNTFSDASSSAAASAANPTPVFDNLAAHLNAQTLPIPVIDSHLFLYLLSDGTTPGGAENTWIDYNGTVVQVAIVYPQNAGITNWTPITIREIVGSMTGGGGWPSGWNMFTSDSAVLAEAAFANNTVGLSQISNWSDANLGTSAGYSVLGYYSNIIRGTIIAGTP